jgi:hypothetical protein
MASNESRTTTDFSIDHILNRAGERFNKCRQTDPYENVSSSASSGDDTCDNYEQKCYSKIYLKTQKLVDIPAFNWLNYTRYNMPRLPSEMPN